MSFSSPSPQPDHQEQTINESDVISDVSLPLNQETLNQPDPPPPTSAPPSPSVTLPDPEYNSPDEEEEYEDEEGGEIDEGQEQETPAISSAASPHMDSPITVQHVSARDVTLPSPSPGSNTRRSATGKRKKAKGKGKPNIKKQQAIEEKLQSLLINLKPISFKPGKIPNFFKHEKLLKKLGLWDFVHTDLDRKIRVDLVGQLIASYEPKNRASKVQDYRISVSRADFARAFKLPVKKKGNNNAGGVVDVDLECEALSDDSIGFVRMLVDDWVLLHEDDDMWMMPNEVANWYKMIKDGHPEKVDWGSLFWFMVEKELKQGGQLKDCYYASHLQYLIKFQRKELFLDVEDEIYEEITAPNEDCVYLMEGPSTKLTLGQDSEKEDEVEGMIVEDVDKSKENDCNEEEPKENDCIEGEPKENDCIEEEPKENDCIEEEPKENDFNEEKPKENDCNEEEPKENDFNEEKPKENDCNEEERETEEQEEVEEEQEQQWLLNGQNKLGEHFMQRCSSGNAEMFERFEEEKKDEEEMDEDEGVNKFHVFPSDDHLEGVEDGFTGNLIQTMESNQMDFDHPHHPQDNQLCNQPSVDIGSFPSFFNSAGKRAIEHNSNDINKKMRINNSWVHNNNNKQLDIRMCNEQMQNAMEQMQNAMAQATLLCEEKERAIHNSDMNQQVLLRELEQRDCMIRRKNEEFFRFERDLGFMESVVDGYKKALKESQRVFSEFKKKANVHEEPTYKDTGLGGLMLTGSEIERRRKIQEEDDDKKLRIMFEQKLKEIEITVGSLFEKCAKKASALDKELVRVNGVMKEFVEWRMIKTSEVKVDDEDEKEGEEPVANPESEEEIDGVEEDEADA